MENTIDTIFWVEDRQLKSRSIENNAKVDGHLHSRYSGIKPDLFLGTPITQLLGVRESYNRPKKICKILEKKGMDFFTISDHDSIFGALELRKRCPEKTFISCEYTVGVDILKDQTIHVGCWGIDYANGSNKPLPDKEVLKIHNNLLKTAREGYEEFAQAGKKFDIPCVLNHPAWQDTSRELISGKQFNDVLNAFKYFEVNGDMQLENLLAIKFGIDKNKILCSGSDSHGYGRLGNQFTATKIPAKTPYEYLKMFKDGEIGIGSRFIIPENIENPSIKDIVYYKFNGTIRNLQGDIYAGIWSYLLKDWGPRKFSTLGLFFGAPSILSFLLGAEYTLPPFLLAELGIFAVIPIGMPIIERLNASKKTRDFYDRYNEYLADMESRSLLKEEENLEKKLDKLNQKIVEIKEKHSEKLPKFISEITGWSKITYRLLKTFLFFHSNYKENKKFIEPIVEKEDDD